MSTWMWDLLGGLIALFILVMIVVDIVIVVVLAAVVRHLWADRKRGRAQAPPPAPSPPPRPSAIGADLPGHPEPVEPPARELAHTG